jgi:transposase
MLQRKTTRGKKIQVTPKEKKWLAAVQRDVNEDALSARRARIIELLADGKRQCDVAAATGAGIATVGRVRLRCLEEGVERAVYGYKPPGAESTVTEKQKTKLVALACTDPPQGHARWTVRLLTEEVVRRGYIKTIGRETVRVILHERGIKPWREKNVVRP